MPRAPLFLLAALGVGGVAHAATFTGVVFEDANYGGGAGRSQAASGGTGLAGVTVELYRQSNNAFIQSTVTGAGGTYSLTSGDTSAQMRVRVVNGSVRSSRTGGRLHHLRARADLSHRGQRSPALVRRDQSRGRREPAAERCHVQHRQRSGSTFPADVCRSPSPRPPAANGSTIANIDFGFNFDTVVNTRDVSSCGATTLELSLPGIVAPVHHQFGRFGGEGALAQSGSGQIDGATTACRRASSRAFS